MNNVYVTLLSSDNYVNLVIGLDYSLRMVKSQFPLLVLATDNLSSRTYSKLKEYNIQYKTIPYKEFNPLQINDNEKRLVQRYKTTINKLEVFNLKEYDNLLFLDADIYVLKNLDSIFKVFPQENAILFSSINTIKGVDKQYYSEFYEGYCFRISPAAFDYNELFDIAQQYNYYTDEQVFSHYFRQKNCLVYLIEDLNFQKDLVAHTKQGLKSSLDDYLHVIQTVIKQNNIEINFTNYLYYWNNDIRINNVNLLKEDFMNNIKDNKYKERTPKETIRIITKFFYQKGYTIKIPQILHSEADTWSCVLELFWKNNLVLIQNGKGQNKNHCLASGYAELYERFCNNGFIINNPFLYGQTLKQHKEKYDYYFNEYEKEITLEDMLKLSRIKNHFSALGSIDTVKNYFSLIYENNFIGVPFKHLYKINEYEYLDPRIINAVSFSSGMAAGNNLYEALVQGLSEVFEHHVTSFHFTDLKEYHFIDLDAVASATNKLIIDKLRKLNYDIYTIDFSYNFHMPVLCSILVNKNTHTINIDYGSFPVFDIALERTLTELYQGYVKADELFYNYLLPSNDYDLLKLQAEYQSSPTKYPAFPEYFFMNMIHENNYNEQYFLSNEDYNSQQLLNFYKQLCQQENYEIYYWDCSKSPLMSAVKIFANNLTAFTAKLNYVKNNLINNNIIQLSSEVYCFIYDYLYNDIYNIDQLYVICDKIKHYLKTVKEGALYGLLTVNEWLAPYETQTNLASYIIIITHLLLDDTLTVLPLTSFYFPQAKEYYTAYRYLNHHNYNQMQTNQFLSILGYDVQNISQYRNKDYIIKKIFFETLKASIESTDYQNYLKTIL